MVKRWCFDVSESARKYHIHASLTGGDHPFRIDRSCETRREIIEIIKSCSDFVEVDNVDQAGKTPLYTVCEKGYADIAEFLLDMGATIGIRRAGAYNRRFTALHVAAEKGRAQVVKLLLSRGATVDLHASGCTPLHLACSRGNDMVAKILLRYGADINMQTSDESHLTALEMAVRKGREQTVELLLARGADVSTALQYATSSDIAKLLVENGADPLKRDNRGVTLLHSAVLREQLERVELLIECGVPVDVTDHDGQTPLHCACKVMSLNAVECLLEMGAHVNQVDSVGRTPLHVAAGQHFPVDLMLVELLLEWGADVNALDSYGHTALSLFLYRHNALHYIATIFTKQISAMQAQSLPVSEVNLQALSEHGETRKMRETCEAELENMRAKIGHSNVTFFDVFTKSPVELAEHAANKGVAQVLRTVGFEKKFQTFAYDIRKKFNQCRQRLRLQRKSESVLRLGSFRHIPYPVIRRLNRFLKNEDLDLIIKAKNL